MSLALMLLAVVCLLFWLTSATGPLRTVKVFGGPHGEPPDDGRIRGVKPPKSL